MSEDNDKSPVERVRAQLAHGQRFDNVSIVVRVDDLAAVLATTAPTVEEIKSALLDATSSESTRGFVRVDNAVRAVLALVSPRGEPTAEEEAAHQAAIDLRIAEHEEHIAGEDTE